MYVYCYELFLPFGPAVVWLLNWNCWQLIFITANWPFLDHRQSRWCSTVSVPGGIIMEKLLRGTFHIWLLISFASTFNSARGGDIFQACVCLCVLVCVGEKWPHEQWVQMAFFFFFFFCVFSFYNQWVCVYVCVCAYVEVLVCVLRWCVLARTKVEPKTIFFVVGFTVFFHNEGILKIRVCMWTITTCIIKPDAVFYVFPV